MKNQQVVASVIFVVVVAWMFIPRGNESMGEEPYEPERTVTAMPAESSNMENADVLTIRAARISPQPYVEQIRVRGRTQASRHVEVRAEQAGRIVSEPIPRGARVNQGDLLCELAVDNRDSNLLEALARQEQAQFEYDAASDLQQRGLHSDVAVAQMKAALESSKAGVSRAELALKQTRVVAPFAGVVETRTVEVGDLLNVGTVCASVLDDSPMLLVGLVPEQDINGMKVGAQVSGKLISGEVVTGQVTYLARAADAISRSYRVEIEVDSQYRDIRQGITVELMVDSEELIAHLIPSSALTLNDNGSIAVKTIGTNNTIQSPTVEIIGDSTNQINAGVWVTGLSGTVSLVTLGQEIVFPGQIVESNYDWDN